MAIVRKSTPRPAATPVDATQTLEDLRTRLRTAGLLTVPLNIRAVAEFLGIEVVEEPMDDDLSGYLELQRDHWVAGVNMFHHNNRKRFTIAHEIAHFLLHSNTVNSFHDRTFARRESEGSPMEREADAFAAALLMPANDVRLAIAGGETTLSSLAERFKVSTLAMKFRVMKLGYKVNQ
jgi:Zn-dependent peptidase ImmA (M78 family)